MKKRIGVMIVVFILVLSSFTVLAEPQEEDCNFWCKITSLFTPRENLAGSATCTGFWECLLQRGNLAGKTDE
ncbi:hypothetical protein HYT52_05260 [Candidatus Woesearchaeota archaeon]|nr:hypothetical protein [Candidatus Woesearchaeota archaeon]